MKATTRTFPGSASGIPSIALPSSSSVDRTNAPRTRLALVAISLGILGGSAAAATSPANQAPLATPTITEAKAGVSAPISATGDSQHFPVEAPVPDADGHGTVRVVHSDDASPEVALLRTDLLDWAVGRFEDAGLALPPLDVEFLDGDECNGYVGILSQRGDRLLVKTCATGGQLRQNLLHELAHAWDRGGGIPHTIRDDFLAMRGLDDWHNPADDWSHRGIEHAAEIVAWGLEVAQWDIFSAIADVGPQDTDSLRAAFQFLTGRTPLWAMEPRLDIRDRTGGGR